MVVAGVFVDDTAGIVKMVVLKSVFGVNVAVNVVEVNLIVVYFVVEIDQNVVVVDLF